MLSNRAILLVEDDPIVAESLQLTLSYRGFDLSVAPSIERARSLLAKHQYDAGIVDIALPDGNGLDLCRELHGQYPWLPILLLTARTDEASAIQGIEAGAEDYVRKPCGLGELTARLNRMISRAPLVENKLRFGSLQVDVDNRIAQVNDTRVGLRRREFEILLFFIRHSDQTISRQQLLQSMDADEEVFDRAIDSHVCRLRNGLKRAGWEDGQIVSVYGAGYRLENRA